jgi:phosphoserine aminotransferase
MQKKTVKSIFNAGPAALPTEVLQQIKAVIPNAEERFESVLEIGHRTPTFEDILRPLEQNIRDLYGLPKEFSVTFLQGGSHTVFGMVPIATRHLPDPQFVVSGRWGYRAAADAERVRPIHRIVDTSAEPFPQYPHLSSKDFADKAAYSYFVTNETVQGLQIHESDWEAWGQKNLVADMSSDFLSYPFDFSPFQVVFACAQKNLGIAGVTIVLARDSFLDSLDDAGLPEMFSLKKLAAAKSCYNTSPVFAIFVSRLVSDWILSEFGSLAEVQKESLAKASAIYEVVDKFPSVFKACVKNPHQRSNINAVFRMKNESAEKDFLNATQMLGMVGLRGHRSMGGVRVSMYNSTRLDQVEELAAFMESYAANK